MSKNMLAGLCVVVVSTSCICDAQVEIFDDEAEFVLAAGAGVLEDFNDIAEMTLEPGMPIGVGSLTLEHKGCCEMTFVRPGTASNNVDGTRYLDVFVIGPDPVVFPLGEGLRITFPTEVVAVGFDLADSFSLSLSFGADVIADGELILNTWVEGLAGSNGPSAGFLGFTSEEPIGYIEFSTPSSFGEAFGIDNIRYVTACRSCDINTDGTISVADLLEYLGLWFNETPAADVTSDGEITVTDLLGFLECWFTGSASACL